MKRLKQLTLVVLLCGLLTCTFLSIFTAAAAGSDTLLGPNLMPNGSFESPIPASGGPNEYELQWGAKVYTATDENDEKVRTGSKSIVLEGKVGSQNIPFARTTDLTAEITAGSEYELSMYVRAEGYRGYQYLAVFYNSDQSAPVDSQDIHFANNVSNEEGVWVKLTYKFTLNETYGDSNVPTTGFRFVFYNGQVTADGNLYIDDIELKKVLKEGEITPGISLSIDMTTDKYNPLAIAFGKEITVAAPVATYMDATGQTTDISDKVMAKLTQGENGENVVKDNVAADAAGRTFTPNAHGFYQYTFTVEHEGATATKTVYMGVQDTLQEIRVDDSKPITVAKGQEPDWNSITVEYKRSYTTAWTPVPAGLYTIDKSGFDKDVADTYTLTVTMKVSYYQHDITVSDTFEVTVADGEVDHTDVALTVDKAGTEIQNVAYGLEFDLPAASATATDKSGATSAVAESDIKVTIQHGVVEASGTTWTDVSGYVNRPYSEFKRFAPNNHGYFRAVYTVEYAGKNDSKNVQFNIADTLQEISVDDNDQAILWQKGEELDLSDLVVNKKLSYSYGNQGWIAAAADEYTVDRGDFDKDTLGRYTLTVTMKKSYYLNEVTKTDTFVVEVVDEVDYTAVKLTVDKAGTTIENVAYGLAFDLPVATAQATDQGGTVSDATNDIKITVQHGVAGTDGTIWTDVKGYVGLSYKDFKQFTPNNHGFFQIVYTVEYEGKTDTKKIQINIVNLLESISIAENQQHIYVEQGSDIDLSKLSITQKLSYDGVKPVTPAEMTVVPGDFDKDVLGDYDVTIKVIKQYVNGRVEKEVTIKVTVAEEGSIDLSNATLAISSDVEKVVIGYQMPYTFPTAVAKGYDKDGKETDISAQIKVTLQRGEATATQTTWTDVEGHANLAMSQESRTFTPDLHGYYRLKYEVTYAGKTVVVYFAADIADTLQSVTVNSATANIKVHKGETPNLNSLDVAAVYSYSGSKNLLPEKYTVDYGDFNAQSGVGTYTVTITVTQVLANGTVTKSGTFTIEVVPDSEEIDRTSVIIKTDRASDNIPNKKEYLAPDVTVVATDKDGNPIDLHDQVKVTFQHCVDTDNKIWADIVGYVDLPITDRTFIADMHGYCRVIYEVEYEGKTAQAVIDLNIMDTLHGISVNTEYIDTRITKGEDLDLSKLVVLKKMSYTGEKAVADGEYTVDWGNFDKNVPGKYTIKILYGEVYGGDYETEFEVEVRDVILSFTVTKNPSRTELSYGEEFDMNGIEAEVVFETLGKQNVPSSEIEIKGYSPRKVGKQTVEFYYDDVKGGQMEVTVLDSFYAVVLDTEGVKLTYKKGEALNVEGLKVYKVMVSGIRTELTADQYTIDAGDFTKKSGAGTYTITVNAEIDGVSRGAAFEITVQSKGGCGGSIAHCMPVFAAVLVLACVMLIKKKNA